MTFFFVCVKTHVCQQLGSLSVKKKKKVVTQCHHSHEQSCGSFTGGFISSGGLSHPLYMHVIKSTGWDSLVFLSPVPTFKTACWHFSWILKASAPIRGLKLTTLSNDNTQGHHSRRWVHRNPVNNCPVSRFLYVHEHITVCKMTTASFSFTNRLWIKSCSTKTQFTLRLRIYLFLYMIWGIDWSSIQDHVRLFREIRWWNGDRSPSHSCWNWQTGVNISVTVVSISPSHDSDAAAPHLHHHHL